MGKWSEDMSVVVTHSQRDAMSNVARDTSGDVAEVFMLYGVRVGVSGLFSIVYEFSWSVYVVPRVSVFCASSHSVLCAFGSPKISEFCRLFRGSSWRL